MHIMRCLPRFRRAARDMNVLADREAWSRTRIEAYQLDRLNELWGETIIHVPYYAGLSRKLRLPDRFSSVEEFSQTVPILPKSHVRQRASELLSTRKRRGFWTLTSGSTGTPMAAFWSNDAHRQSLSVKYRSYAAWGVDVFDRSVFLWGHGASEEKGVRGWASRTSQPYIDRLRNRLRLSACALSRSNLRDYLAKIQAFKPTMLYGYARALYLLALEAEQTGFKCDSLKLVVATSEPTWPHMVERMERAFGARVAREYGSIECGIIATDVPQDRTLRIREDRVLLETAPRDDGQYDIIVTVLDNPSFPLIRYAIDDVTAEPLQRNAAGFAVLSGVAGRNSDFLRTRSGEYLHWVHVEYAISDTVQDLVRRFSVRQRGDGSVIVEVELDDPSRHEAARPNLVALRKSLEGRLEGYAVEVRVVDAVAQTAAGKHLIVRSELDGPNMGSTSAAASRLALSVATGLSALEIACGLVIL